MDRVPIVFKVLANWSGPRPKTGQLSRYAMRMSPALVCALFGGKIGINDFQRNIWGKMKVGVARQIDEAQSTSHFN